MCYSTTCKLHEKTFMHGCFSSGAYIMGFVTAVLLSIINAVIIVYVLYLIKKFSDKKYFSKYLHNIPGPTPHVFFGNALDVVPGKGVTSTSAFYKLLKTLLTPAPPPPSRLGQPQKVPKTVRTGKH
ncbi:unnamed protein product, partial [Callosobruchus maculatus]